MLKVFVPLAACALCTSSLAGGDFNPPSWRGYAQSTTQGWTFGKGYALPGDPPDNELVTTRNPYTVPANILYPDEPTGPHIAAVQRQRINDNPFMTLAGVVLDNVPSVVAFAIPNIYAEDTTPLMRIQIVYLGLAPYVDVRCFNHLTHQNDIATMAAGPIVDAPAPGRPGWRHLTYDFVFSKASNWQMVSLINFEAGDVDIESIVIDTIVPSPGAAGMGIVGLGWVASRRRR